MADTPSQSRPDSAVVEAAENALFLQDQAGSSVSKEFWRARACYLAEEILRRETVALSERGKLSDAEEVATRMTLEFCKLTDHLQTVVNEANKLRPDE